MTAPVITSISPTTFDPGGGTSVTINGSKFVGTTQVKIGGYAVGFTVNSGTNITATAPSYAQALASNYNLVVTNASGGGSYDNEWTWTPPHITSISPNSGSPAGGGTCTITGDYFEGSSTTLGWSSDSPSGVIVSGTEITVTIPSHASAGANPASVSVIGPAGESNFVNYTYDPPSISSTSPGSGDPAGGTTITINGQYFTGATAVTLGGASVSFSFISDTEIQFSTPAGVYSGELAIAVTTPLGTATKSNGTAITISGSYFDGQTYVQIGGVNCTSFDLVSDSEITCNTPAGAPGQSTIRFTGTNSGTFTYIGFASFATIVG